MKRNLCLTVCMAMTALAGAQSEGVRYYTGSGALAGRSQWAPNTGNVQHYGRNGAYLGRTNSTATGQQFYTDRGTATGRAQQFTPNSANYYDKSGRMIGRTQNSGNTTRVYDNTGSYVMRQEIGPNGSVRLYDSTGRYQGRADQINAKTPVSPTGIIAQKTLLDRQNAKKKEAGAKSR